jgi:predicted MFS family arabinose efflux permease
LGYRDFRLLWSSGVIMQTSEWVQSITLEWLALNLTNSAAFVGQVNALLGLPLLLLSLPAGALLDRVDRRSTLLVCQAIGAVVATGIGLTIYSSALAPWHLLAAALLNGILLAVSVPAIQALGPAMVARSDVTNAVAVSVAGSSSTRIVGPPLGGVIIATAGGAGSFVFQAIALVFAAMLAWLMRIDIAPPGAPRAPASTKRPGVLSLIRRDPVIAGLLLQAMAPGLLAYPVLALLPVLARDHLGLDSVGLGLLMASSGTGAVTGSLVVAVLGPSRHKVKLLVCLGVLYGLVLTAFAQSSSPILSGVLFGFSSGLGVSHNALTSALLQSRTPESLRGQVTGASILSFGLTPIGALLLGELAQHVGVSNAISAGATTCTLCIALTMLRYRTFFRL